MHLYSDVNSISCMCVQARLWVCVRMSRAWMQSSLITRKTKTTWTIVPRVFWVPLKPSAGAPAQWDEINHQQQTVSKGYPCTQPVSTNPNPHPVDCCWVCISTKVHQQSTDILTQWVCIQNPHKRWRFQSPQRGWMINPSLHQSGDRFSHPMWVRYPLPPSWQTPWRTRMYWIIRR